MEMLCNYKTTTIVWNKVMEEAQWSKFFSLGLSHWLESNLKSDEYGSSRWPWPSLFGIVCNIRVL